MPEIYIQDSLDLPIVFLKHLLKTNREYKNLKKQKIKDIYQNELGKTCFQYDIP